MGQESIIFYVPYDFSSLESGSKVRPYRMYQAFVKLGYDVVLISGNLQERIKKYKEVIDSSKKYAFCYVELASYPLHPVVDYQIILGVRRRAIPIGVYYRDAYWKFSNYFHYKGAKRVELLLRYHSDLLLISLVSSAIFFPTGSLAKVIKSKAPKFILPPGGEYIPVVRKFQLPLRAIYVGGVTFRYGIHLMLEALHLLNQKKICVTLDLVCRRKELENLPQQTKKLLNVPWINVYHVSGNELQILYRRNHIGLLPLLKDKYNDLAMPIKLFEYLSFGLPIVATNCKEIMSFIEANKCGVICEDNPQSLAKSFKYLIQFPNRYRELSINASKTIRNGHSWEHRAKTVAHILSAAHIKSKKP